MTFPSATYTVTIEQVQFGAQQWHLIGRDAACAAVVQISEDFFQSDWLRQALFSDGFATRYATIGQTILDRMVRLQLAERLTAPRQLPQHGRGWPWAWCGPT